MLQILFIWFIVFLVSFAFGKATLSAFHFFFKRESQQQTSLLIMLLLGLVSITVLLSIVHFWLPINSVFLQILILCFTVFQLLYHRKMLLQILSNSYQQFVSLSFLYKISILFFLVFVCYQTSIQPQGFDAGGYHLPYIKWLEKYSVVKGLANVHSRFGFNYHYLLLYAFFGFANWFGTTIHALGGFFFLVGFFYFLPIFGSKSESLFFKIIAAIALLYIAQINKGMMGFSPDFPVAIMQMIIAIECLRYLINKQLNNTPFSVSFFASMVWICFGLISFKLAAVAIVLVFFIAFFKEIFNNKLFIAFCGLLIFIPFLYRNYLLSGYLVYPFDAVDIFHVPWKVPLIRTIHEKIVIKNFALGYPDFYNDSYKYNFALFQKWIHRLIELNKAYLPVVFATIICLFYFMGLVVKNIFQTNYKRLSEPVFLITYGLVFGLFFWWYFAPDLRFGNGIILPFIAILISHFVVTVLPKFNFKPVSFLVPLVLIFTSVFAISGKQISQAKSIDAPPDFSFINQPVYPSPDTVSVHLEGYILYKGNSDLYGKCWECPLPCNYMADDFKFIKPYDFQSGFLPNDSL